MIPSGTHCHSDPSIDDAAAINILHDLVSIPSVSGGERRVVEQFVRAGRGLGLRTHIDAAGNAVATRPARSTPAKKIILLGHIDTVPGEIPVRIENGILHGRGSVDAKGPLCAMLVSASRAELPDDVAVDVVGAVGEETADSPGAQYIRDHEQPDACIIGEPSGWEGVTLGYKGRVLVRASTDQGNHHSAHPAPSPADRLFAWWQEVLACTAHTASGGARLFDQIQASIARTDTTNDGLTSRAVIHAGFRLPLGTTSGDLSRAIESVTPPDITLAFGGGTDAYATDRADPVVRALSVSIRAHGARARHKVKTGTADLNVVAPAWRCPIAAYGPGDSSLDHTPDEHVHIEEYLRSISVLTGAISALAEQLVAASREGSPSSGLSRT